MKYFYDSYAFIEYLKDNPDLVKYFEEESGILTEMNVLEIGYYALCEEQEQKMPMVISYLMQFIVHPTEEEINEAVLFRKKNCKKGVSYVDSLGYTMAKKRRLKFLTGDEAFKGMPNVEFVK